MTGGIPTLAGRRRQLNYLPAATRIDGSVDMGSALAQAAHPRFSRDPQSHVAGIAERVMESFPCNAAVTGCIKVKELTGGRFGLVLS